MQRVLEFIKTTNVQPTSFDFGKFTGFTFKVRSEKDTTGKSFIEVDVGVCLDKVSEEFESLSDMFSIAMGNPGTLSTNKKKTHDDDDSEDDNKRNEDDDDDDDDDYYSLSLKGSNRPYVKKKFN